MKPCVHSFKSDKSGKTVWRRKGFNIYYDLNDLCYEDNPKKNYKTLTFEYDFTVENDTVQFAHAMPYTVDDLNQMLETVKTNPKVSVHTVGSTYMGQSMPMIKISSEQKGGVQRKAIIIMARQHPGETVGSYIVEEIVHEILRHSTET